MKTQWEGRGYERRFEEVQREDCAGGSEDESWRKEPVQSARPARRLRTSALTSLSICRIKYEEPGNRIKRALFSTFSRSRIRRRAAGGNARQIYPYQPQTDVTRVSPSPSPPGNKTTEFPMIGEK